MQQNKVFDLLMGDDANKNKPKVDRPIAITLLCLLLFVGSSMQALTGLGVMMANKGLTMDAVSVRIGGAAIEAELESQAEAAAQDPASPSSATPPPNEWGIYALTTSLLLLASVFGLWQMRHWGVYLFAAVMLVNIITLFFITPEWAGLGDKKPWGSLLYPAIYLLVVLPYWKKLGTSTINNPENAEA